MDLARGDCSGSEIGCRLTTSAVFNSPFFVGLRTICRAAAFDRDGVIPVIFISLLFIEPTRVRSQLLATWRRSGVHAHPSTRRRSCRLQCARRHVARDRKSTRLNSSHVKISYAVFCLKKKRNPYKNENGRVYQ